MFGGYNETLECCEGLRREGRGGGSEMQQMNKMINNPLKLQPKKKTITIVSLNLKNYTQHTCTCVYCICTLSTILHVLYVLA